MRYQQDRKYQESKLLSAAYEKVRSHIANSQNSAYTSLTTIPKTNFSCRGRKGVFADVETKCQVSSKVKLDYVFYPPPPPPPTTTTTTTTRVRTRVNSD